MVTMEISSDKQKGKDRPKVSTKNCQLNMELSVCPFNFDVVELSGVLAWWLRTEFVTHVAH